MKRIIIGITAALVIMGGIAVATPSRGYDAKPLGSLVVDSLSIQPAGKSVALFVRASIQDGGTTGWHSHPSHVFVLVRAGTVAVMDGDTCKKTVYTKGDVFMETPDHVHKAVNVGDGGVLLMATFVGLPPNTPATTDEANPCN